MYGIYVQTTRAIDYAAALVKGYKPLESRPRDVFKSIDLHQKTAVIRTGKGRKPEIVGFVTMERGYRVTADEFRRLYVGHLVPPGSKYDTDERGKWLYKVTSFEALDTPIELPANRINHGRSYTEFTL